MSRNRSTPPARPRPQPRAEFLGSFPGKLPPQTVPEIALVGRSNVGKSSAINALLGRKQIARVSGKPGRTRTINLIEIDDRLRFADLPGYGYAKVSHTMRNSWKTMIERYLQTRSTLRLVIVLVDARHSAQELDLALLSRLEQLELPALVVATKVDKLRTSQRKQTLQKLGQGLGLPKAPLAFSSTKRMGIAPVWAAIDRACR